MPVTIYRSTDAGAPVLSGEVGKIAEVLKACLVTGYGALPGVGWTCPAEATGRKSFRNNSVLGTGMYLLVDDNAPGAGLGKEARVYGYESMSDPADLDTGVNLIGLRYIRKSSLADTTVRAWIVVASDRTFYLWIFTGDSNGSTIFGAGDFKSLKVADPYRFFMSGRVTENNSTMTVNTTGVERFAVPGASLGQAYSVVIARSWTEVLGPVVGSTFWNSIFGSNTGLGGTGSMTYPGAIGGELFLGKVYIGHPTAIRGEMPGVMCPYHNRPLANEDTCEGVDGAITRQFIVLNQGNNAQAFFEISDTWEY